MTLILGLGLAGGAMTRWNNLAINLTTIALATPSRQQPDSAANPHSRSGIRPTAALTTSTYPVENVVWTSIGGAASADANTLSKYAGPTNWNAGAVSTRTIVGDGYVEFSTNDNTTGKRCGLSFGDTNQTEEDIDFALSLGSGGNVRVYEFGTLKGSFGTYTAEDLFRVAVESGVVKYYKNGTLLYTSESTPAYRLLVDTSLYTVGAKITNAVISCAPPLEDVVWRKITGVAASTNNLKRTGTTSAWNAGASSTKNIVSGDGYVEFTATEADLSRMCGLNSSDLGLHYSDIDFAISLGATGILRVYESGTPKGTFGNYVAGDKFRVAVESGAVKYYKNGVLIYTSLLVPSYPLVADASLFTPNATITKAVISGAVQPISTAGESPVNQLPVAQAGGPYTLSNAVPVQFEGRGSYDPDGSIVDYQWDFGDGTTASGPNPTHTFVSPSGNRTVFLTVTDNRGTSTSTAVSVTYNRPEGSTAAVTVNFDNLPTGAFVYNQYAQNVTFTAGNGEGPRTWAHTPSYGNSQPNHLVNYVGSYATGDISLRFAQPVSNLGWKTLAVDAFPGTGVAIIDVYEMDQFKRTLTITAQTGDPYKPLDIYIPPEYGTNITRIDIRWDTDPNGLGFDDFTFTPVNQGRVEWVNFDQIPGLNILDPNPNAPDFIGDHGWRVFPDRLWPSDQATRNIVKVRAETSLGPNKTVYFRPFDLDDPSSDDINVDITGGNGNDNRGTPDAGNLFGNVVDHDSFGNAIIAATTNSYGQAIVDFQTSMYPGDNYTVAASDDLAYLKALNIVGTSIRDATYPLPTAKARKAQMLTVWRRLHVEVDSLGVVTGNSVTGNIVAVAYPGGSSTDPCGGTEPWGYALFSQPLSASDGDNRFQNGRLVTSTDSYQVLCNDQNGVTFKEKFGTTPGGSFTMYDDDDFNSSETQETLKGDNGEDVDALPDMFSLMQQSDSSAQNVYAMAYIVPFYDSGGDGSHEEDSLPFVLNVEYPTAPISTINSIVNAQGDSGRNSGGNENDGYWVVYVQIDYQGPTRADKDPNGGDAHYGITIADTTDFVISTDVPKGGHNSLVFPALLSNSEFGDILALTNLRMKTIPHEVGHQFGLGHGDDSPQFGIMSSDPVLAQHIFAPQHLNILRWRVKSPGQQ